MSSFVWMMPPYKPNNGGPYYSVLESVQHADAQDCLILTFGKTNLDLEKAFREKGIPNLEFKSKSDSIYGLGRLTAEGRRAISQANSIVVEGFYGLPLIYAVLFSSSNRRLLVIPHGAVGQPTNKARIPKSVFVTLVKLILGIKRTSISFLALSALEKEAIKSIFQAANIEIRGRRLQFKQINQKARESSFTYLGRLSSEKGVLEIVSLFSEFQRFNQRYILKIAGSGDSSYTSKLMSACENLGVSSSVKFLGWLNSTDKDLLLSETSGLICLSPYESLGLSVLEAMEHRVPIFTTDRVGAAEFVNKLGIGLVSSTKSNLLADFLKFESQLEIFSNQYRLWSAQESVILQPENFDMWEANG